VNQQVLVQDETTELAVIEAAAREAFNAATYEAQSAWHSRNEEIHRAFQDAIEDNNAIYRAAMTVAQRGYRDATADTYR
jgi:hypothetical protein